MTKTRLLWYLKQLLPLTYWTTHKQGKRKIFSIWTGWMGKPYHIVQFEFTKGGPRS
jgi:hypothetical protein